MKRVITILLAATNLIQFGCRQNQETLAGKPDLILINSKVYTLAWPNPGPDGQPSPEAPFSGTDWSPQAEALAISDGIITHVGTTEKIQALAGDETQIYDAMGGTVVPGLVDSHTHVINLGQNLELVDLTGVETEEEAVDLIVEQAVKTPSGEWIIGKGWDEGAWASHYPDKKMLSRRVPNHPVVMRSLHSFATWANQMALDRAGITKETPSPRGGEIVKDDLGEPTGLFLNKGSDILEAAIPQPGVQQLKSYFLKGLREMARSGYVSIHEAGVGKDLLDAIMELDQENRLPIRVYVMLDGEDEELLSEWRERGPFLSASGMLTIRSVKSFYDGALGSRGALLLEDYSDQPGHRGTSGQDYRFRPEILRQMALAGFQLGIHAIGDGGNRATLDFIEELISEDSTQKNQRHRIEHAQVLHPDDIGRLSQLEIIASMEPSHAVEDMPWAEDRLGPSRIKGAYAWRTLRKLGTHLIFNSDLTGTDHNIFYGLHSAITRQNRNFEPAKGWFPEQSVTAEEALMAFTKWAAWSVFEEDSLGIIAPGRKADISILSIDPLQIGATNPNSLFDGKVLATIVNGQIKYNSKDD